MKTLLRISLVLLALLMLLATVACKKQDEEDDAPSNDTPSTKDETGTDILAKYDPNGTYEFPDLLALNMEDYITLGRYRGLSLVLDYDALMVTEKDLEEQIAGILEENKEFFAITDRPVQWGDTVVTDYVGTIDGVAFEGGSTSEPVTITLQDNSGYIDGFVEGLVGAEIGVAHPADVTFPDPYPNNTDLSGKPAVFTFTVKYIVGEMALTDAFVAHYTNGEYTDAEAFRAALLKEMEEQALTAERYEKLWTKIAENAAVKQYPEAGVLYFYNTYYQNYYFYATMYGVDMDTFLSVCGMTTDTLLEGAKASLKNEMIYYAVAQAGGYSCTDEQYDEILREVTEQNYEALKANMAQEGKEDYTFEEAMAYFDERYRSQLINQCQVKIATEDLLASATITVSSPSDDTTEESEQ